MKYMYMYKMYMKNVKLFKYSTGRDMVLHITLRDIWSDMSDM